MIVLDTTVLVYAVGERHELREPSQQLLRAIGDGALQATSTPEVIQEFVHVRARRRDREDASALGTAYCELLAPLMLVDEDDLRMGLALYERRNGLGCFDAVLAAAARRRGAAALVSADRAFAAVPELRHVQLARGAVERLLA